MCRLTMRSRALFFGNLLQEGDGALRQVRDREGLGIDDIAGLLFHIGKDCPGALSVLPQGAPPVKVPGNLDTDYDPISEQELTEIVRSLHQTRRLPDQKKNPSPLAGVQGKIALTYLPNRRFFFP